ncbi:serine/threonine protein kinase [Candidatus Bipolaricaulota bacterium]
MAIDLLSIDQAEIELEALLKSCGRIVRAYRQQDSGCVSYVVDHGSRRLFVKAAITDAGAESLTRAAALHAAVRHPALPTLLNTFRCIERPVHVYEWVSGTVLYDYVTMDGERGRCDPTSAHARFRVLPVTRILDALDVIYDLHVRIAATGFIAVDFYDGCVLYDFDEHRTWICDLDEYRPGPFTLDAERLPGSRRFMAPEEFVHGSTIDQRTNVFTLGRTAAVLLSDGDVSSPSWRGRATQRVAIERATSIDRSARFPSVASFVDAWTCAAQ